MQRRTYITFGLVSLFSWLMAVGCGASLSSVTTVSDPGGAATITVSAAASLQDALDAIAPQFAADYPKIVVDYNFASSGALQRQIEQGAPVDIFFSAATQQMDALAAKGLLVSDSRQTIVTNSLVLVAPQKSALEITAMEQLQDIDINSFAVGEFRSVPAGQYAKQVFQTLNLLESFQSKFVFGNNVRSVLAAVESGNVDLGMVYASDAVLARQSKTLVTVPAELHQPIVYPIAVVQTSAVPDAAQSFIEFLTTDTAQTIFEEFGFSRL